mmetsp:Transcript_16109/g.45110  ORF Transcript_16109/g.45110 Transcript_16109/m.45110 type:complete len:225 (+) Transcript_16109:549-1223(+)
MIIIRTQLLWYSTPLAIVVLMFHPKRLLRLRWRMPWAPMRRLAHSAWVLSWWLQPPPLLEACLERKLHHSIQRSIAVPSLRRFPSGMMAVTIPLIVLLVGSEMALRLVSDRHRHHHGLVQVAEVHHRSLVLMLSLMEAALLVLKLARQRAPLRFRVMPLLLLQVLLLLRCSDPSSGAPYPTTPPSTVDWCASKDLPTKLCLHQAPPSLPITWQHQSRKWSNPTP